MPHQQLSKATQRRIHRIEVQTMGLRHLKQLRSVRVEFLGNRAFNHFIAGTYKQANSNSQLHIADVEDVMLGLISPRLNLAKVVTGGLTSQVVGLYDKHRKVLFIRNTGRALTVNRWVIAHEFTHALQDQHFGLSKVEPDQSHWKLKNSDAELAQHSLIEGDAVNIQYTYARTFYDPQDLAALNREIGSVGPSHVPAIIEQQFQFPYQEGLLYVYHLLQSGGFSRDDQAFRHPPNSTFEVMFPGQNVVPANPRISKLGGSFKPWKRRDDDVIGAFGYYQLVERWESRARANQLASLWRGDRYLLLYRRGHYAMYLDASFGTSRSARVAASILESAVAKRFHHRLAHFHGGVWTGAHGTYVAARISGHKVFMAYAPAASIARSMVVATAG